MPKQYDPEWSQIPLYTPACEGATYITQTIPQWEAIIGACNQTDSEPESGNSQEKVFGQYLASYVLGPNYIGQTNPLTGTVVNTTLSMVSLSPDNLQLLYNVAARVGIKNEPNQGGVPNPEGNQQIIHGFLDRNGRLCSDPGFPNY